jgi:hypothetical protein
VESEGDEYSVADLRRMIRMFKELREVFKTRCKNSMKIKKCIKKLRRHRNN